MANPTDVFILKQNGKVIAEHDRYDRAIRDREAYCKRNRIELSLVRVVRIAAHQFHTLMARPRSRRFSQKLKMQSGAFAGRL